MDRFLALFLGLRYRQVVTLRRVRAVIICIWFILSCALGGWRYSTWGSGIARTVLIAWMLLSLLTSVFSYIKIYFLLRHHQNQLQDHAHQGQPRAKRRSNSTEYSTIQEDGFQHSMGAVGITRLLSSLYCCGYAVHVWKNAWKCVRIGLFPCHNLPSLFKLISEPNSLLLPEDQRNETRSEGRNQTIKLLRIQLA